MCGVVVWGPSLAHWRKVNFSIRRTTFTIQQHSLVLRHTLLLQSSTLAPMQAAVPSAPPAGTTTATEAPSFVMSTPPIAPFACHTAAEAVASLREHGVAVLLDVLHKPDLWRDRLFAELATAFPQGQLGDAAGIGDWRNLPPQTRPGMFQALVGNLPSVWALRSYPRVCALFREMYTLLRGVEDVGPLVTSIDGLSTTPPPCTTTHQRSAARPAPAAWAAKYPHAVDPLHDWPHTDQVEGPVDQFLQAQLVLHDTSASFVCSPKSHQLYDAIRTALAGSAASSAPTQSTGAKWFRIKSQKDMAVAADVVARHGGRWQIPIVAPKGAMIVWFSSTIHSARPQVRDDPRWRAVVYVCHRPLREVGDARAMRAHVKRLRRALEENRMTNHSGSKMFPKAPGGRYSAQRVYNPVLEAWKKHPAQMWEHHPTLRPNITSRVAALVGMDDATSAWLARQAQVEKVLRRTTRTRRGPHRRPLAPLQSLQRARKKRARCMHAMIVDDDKDGSGEGGSSSGSGSGSGGGCQDPSVHHHAKRTRRCV